jgi:predicted nuclease with TOPRIM domain
MRRSRNQSKDRGDQSNPQGQHSGPHSYGEFNRPKSASFAGNSSQNTAPSLEPIHAPLRSPIWDSQPTASITLPSPSSFNFHSSRSLPSISPPAVLQTPGQSANLQDLQQQISLKTSELRTLQRDYDSLVQKLERQTAKCATFEKKLEISDGEMNSLTDEKDRLSTQVSAMEGQIEELQQSRDEARQQLVTNGAQYMQIMDMANRLQAQSAEAKIRWQAEKAGLEQRIRLLEEAMVTGSEKPISTSDAEQQPGITRGPLPVGSTHTVGASNSSQIETINVLRAEVSRLRSRTKTLEAAVQTMRCESLSIQTAARQILESSGNMGDISQDIGCGDA